MKKNSVHAQHKQHQKAKRASDLLSRVRSKAEFIRPRKLGTFLHYEQCRIKIQKSAKTDFKDWTEFRKETLRKWAGMSASEKRSWQRARDVAASVKPVVQRTGMHSSLKSGSRSGKKLPTSAYKAGSTSRPIANSLVDEHPSVRYHLFQNV